MSDAFELKSEALGGVGMEHEEACVTGLTTPTTTTSTTTRTTITVTPTSTTTTTTDTIEK